MKKLLAGLTLLMSLSSFASVDCKDLAAKEITNHHSLKFGDAHLTQIERMDEKTGLYKDVRAGSGYQPLFEIYKASITDEGAANLYLVIYKNSPKCQLYDFIKLD